MEIRCPNCTEVCQHDYNYCPDCGYPLSSQSEADNFDKINEVFKEMESFGFDDECDTDTTREDKSSKNQSFISEIKKRLNLGKTDIVNTSMIYRIGQEGMYGWTEEKFLLSLDDAKKEFEELIERRKIDSRTLTDDQAAEENQQEKNFTEYKLKEEKNGVKILREVLWSYGFNDSNENGTEFYSYTDHLVLQEIQVAKIN